MLTYNRQYRLTGLCIRVKITRNIAVHVVAHTYLPRLQESDLSSPSLPQTYDSRRFQLVTLNHQAAIMITLLALATILGAHAVTFSSWLGEPCSGSPAIHEQTLESCKCHSIGNASHASIKGWGLRNTNAKSGDFIELYLDADCQDRFSVLKHGGRCFTARHRSLMYFPPGQFADEVCYLLSGGSEVKSDDI